MNGPLAIVKIVQLAAGLHLLVCSNLFANQELSIDLKFLEANPSIDRPFIVCLTNRAEQPIRVLNPNCPLGHERIRCKIFSNSSQLIDEISPNQNLKQASAIWYRRSGDTRKYVELDPNESVSTLVWLGRWPWRSSKLGKAARLSLVVNFETRGDKIFSGSVEIDPDSQGQPLAATNIFDLVRGGQSERVVERLQANSESVEQLQRAGNNLLHYAAKFNDVATMKQLLQAGKLKVNSKSASGFTALHLARSAAAVESLLNNGADAALDSSDGTAVEIAARKAGSKFSENERNEWLKILELYRNHSCGKSSLRNSVALESYESVASQDLESVTDSDLQRAFKAAIVGGHFDLCQLLIERGAKRLNKDPLASRHLVFQSLEHYQVLKLLIESGFPHDGIDFMEGGYLGDMPIHFHACSFGNVDTVRFLMADRDDLEFLYTDPISGQTDSLLAVAASSGSPELVDLIYQWLKEGRAKLPDNAVDEMIMSAVASALPYPDVLQQMLNYPIEPSEKQILQLAKHAVFWLRNETKEETANGLKASLKVLIDNGAGSDLMSSVAIGDIGQIKKIISKNEDLIFATNENGQTVLHSRLLLEQPDLVSYFLTQGGIALFQKTDKAGKTCLHLACQNDLLQSSLKIIGHEFGINAKDSFGRTPLHFACQNCNVAIAVALLQSGADIEAKDSEGDTPLDYARTSNSVSPIRKLHLQSVLAKRLLSK